MDTKPLLNEKTRQKLKCNTKSKEMVLTLKFKEPKYVLLYGIMCKILVVKKAVEMHGVKESLKRIDNGKAVGSDNMLIEVWKGLGEKGISWPTKLFNEIMRSKKIPV